MVCSLTPPPSLFTQVIEETNHRGFEVPPADPQKISWIKILLDPSQPRPTFVNPKRTTLPRGKKPVDIVTDYLTALRAYTVQTLERRLGREMMSRTKVEYVLTVPAVWSDKARQMTMEAAMRAGLGLGGGAVADEEEEGLGLLKLITEPEGAAEYALRSIQPNSMKVGLYFIFLCIFRGGKKNEEGPVRVRVGSRGIKSSGLG